MARAPYSSKTVQPPPATRTHSVSKRWEGRGDSLSPNAWRKRVDLRRATARAALSSCEFVHSGLLVHVGLVYFDCGHVVHSGLAALLHKSRRNRRTSLSTASAGSSSGPLKRFRTEAALSEGSRAECGCCLQLLGVELVGAEELLLADLL